MRENQRGGGVGVKLLIRQFSLELNCLVDSGIVSKVEKKRLGGIDQ